MTFSRARIRTLVGAIALFTALTFPAVPSFSDTTPQSPEDALGIAALTPKEKEKTPMNPVEATAASVMAIRKVMAQAMDVAALLPKEVKEEKPAVKTAIAKSLEVAAYIPELAVPSQSAKTVVSAKGLCWPTDGLIYSTFGASRGRRAHGAIDIVTKKGTPIAAAADGIVSVVANGGKLFRGYGKIVILDHGKGLFTVYAHCDKTLVRMGQRVAQGEYIATVGRTGRATTDHCHFEVRQAGRKKDPLKYLPSRPEMVKAFNYRSK